MPAHGGRLVTRPFPCRDRGRRITPAHRGHGPASTRPPGGPMTARPRPPPRASPALAAGRVPRPARTRGVPVTTRAAVPDAITGRHRGRPGAPCWARTVDELQRAARRPAPGQGERLPGARDTAVETYRESPPVSDRRSGALVGLWSGGDLARKRAERRAAHEEEALSKGAKLAYRPIGLIGGIAAGMVSGVGLQADLEAVANEDDAPRPSRASTDAGGRARRGHPGRDLRRHQGRDRPRRRPRVQQAHRHWPGD